LILLASVKNRSKETFANEFQTPRKKNILHLHGLFDGSTTPPSLVFAQRHQLIKASLSSSNFLPAVVSTFNQMPAGQLWVGGLRETDRWRQRFLKKHTDRNASS